MAGRKQGTYAQTARVLLILEYLAGQKFGVFLAALATRFSVTERQLRRDLGAIETAGYHIEIRRVENRSHVRLLEAASRPLLISRRERFVLVAARQALAALGGTSLRTEIENVFDKLAQQLSADARAELGTVAERLVYVPAAAPRATAKASLVDALLDGAIDRRLVRVRFRGDDGKEHKCLLAIYSIALHDGGLVVFAHRLGEPRDAAALADRTDAVEVIPVDRFLAADLVGTTARFAPPLSLKRHPLDADFITGGGKRMAKHARRNTAAR